VAIVGRFSALYINQSITKKFLIETLLEMTDSTSPRFVMLESIISKSFSIGNFFVMDRFNWKRQCRSEVNLTSNFSVELGFFDVAGNFNGHIRLPQDVLH